MVFHRLIGILGASSLFLVVGLSTALAEPGIERVEPGGAPPPGSGTVEIEGFVRGIDGDTMELDYQGSKAGVGVIGIEAPQANTACGLEAANQLQAMVMNGVRLEEDRAIAFDNERGLRMYYAVTPDGRSVAEELVKAGVARATGEGREIDRLTNLETEARNAKRGCLWGEELPDNEKSQTQAVEGFQDGSAARAANGDQISAAAVGDFTEDVVAHQLNRPTSFAFLPDGRILIAEQGGTVRIHKNGSLLPTPFIDISDQVNDYWDRGLLDVAVDPNFTENGYVYLLFTYENDTAQYDGSKTARLIRVTASGDTAAPSSESVVLGKKVGSSCKIFPANTDCIPSDYYSHTVGTVEFASDGNMFVTTGDASDFTRVTVDSLRAQDLDSLAGKVLHVTPSGQGIPTNPFFTGSADDNRSKVWAYGVRNAFRMNLRPDTDVPYLGDVGWGAWEEINVASKGSNLGWPCYEGSARQAGWEPFPVCQALYGGGPTAVRQPLTEWNHDGGGAAAVGGTFYTGTEYPTEYQGAYFYGDFARGWLRYLRTDANDQLVGSPTELLSNNSSPVDIEMGPDGNLYYLNIYSADLRRIRYTGTPGEVNCPKGEYLAEYFDNETLSGEPVFRRCETSIQNDWGDGAPPDTELGPDDFSVRWTGDFDFEAGDHLFSAAADDGIRAFVDGEQVIDGWRDQPATLYEATRAAMTAGTHQVKVEYYENTHSAIARFGWQETNPNAAPKPTIAEPTADLKWKVGDTINFSGSATDPEDGAIPASDLSWSVLIHHCSPSGDCHVHNLTTATGADGSFQTINHGADPYYFEIVLTATDSRGKSGKTSVTIRPQTTQMTLDTSPAGLQVVFGGQAGKPPLTRTVAVGSSFSIQAPSPQGGYVFDSWSEGGAQQHDVTAGATDVTYTANFKTSYTATCLKGEYLAEYFDNATLSGTSVARRCETKIDYDWVDQAPIAGVGTNNFSVRWTGDFDFEAGDHLFSATADDGIRAFVDGEQVIDGWRDQPATLYEATRAAMAAGTHQVKVEYYEKYGDATARFNLKKVPGQVICLKGEYLAEYFDNATLSGTSVARRCETKIDYDWVDQAPIAGVGTNNFSVRWTGDFDFEAGDHLFSATADDGIRAFVDGEQVIDGWRDQPATLYEATRAAMAAGTHQVKVEYYEKYGDATARFNWAKGAVP